MTGVATSFSRLRLAPLEGRHPAIETLIQSVESAHSPLSDAAVRDR